ncbi:MAG: hypothetical protein CMH46_16345 [Muricauda sp.]|nr:hypothetical protein [Allomuricauda sp.]
MYIADTSMDNQVSPDSKAYPDFLKKFDSFLDVFKSMSQIGGIELAPFPLYYNLENTYVLKFLFHNMPDGIDHVSMFASALDTITDLYREKEGQLKSAIEKFPFNKKQ